MSISLDHAKAQAILLHEVTEARRGAVTELVKCWHERVANLGSLCPHGRSSTVVAALGTAILAKATDQRVDVYALLDRGEAHDSYSARSLADNVWARNRAALGIDLGANGTNPLNNTPFIGKTRIDEITGVRNQEGWRYFIDCMEALKTLRSSAEAQQALRGFILARSRSLLTPVDINPQAGDDLAVTALLDAMDKYVAEDSEGGRRAQACAAAMLDAAFGADRVRVGVINDPDRHSPLDISLTDGGDAFLVAFEVKDKPIVDYHVQSSIEKTVKDHSLSNMGFIAVSKQQQQRNFDEVVKWAAKHGVKITIFLDWQSVYLACKCFAPPTQEVFEGKVYRRLLARGEEIGVAVDGLRQLRALTG